MPRVYFLNYLNGWEDKKRETEYIQRIMPKGLNVEILNKHILCKRDYQLNTENVTQFAISTNSSLREKAIIIKARKYLTNSQDL